MLEACVVFDAAEVAGQRLAENPDIRARPQRKLRSARRDGAPASNGDGFAFDLKKNRKLIHGCVLTFRALFRVRPNAS